MLYILFYIIFSLFILFPSCAQEDNILQAPEKYSVAYTQIEGASAFGKRWSHLIQNKMAVIKNHVLSEEEKKAMVKNLRAQILYDLSKKLSQTQDNLATIQLKQASTERRQGYSLFLEQEKLKGQIKKLQNEKDPSIPDTLEIEIKKEDSVYNPNLNLIFPETSLWVHGRAAPLSAGVYYLEYYAYDSLREKTYTLIKQSIGEEKILSAVETAANRLRGILLGRSWGALDLRSSVAGTRYYLNDKEVQDPRVLDILIPGKYTLIAKTSGYQDQKRDIEVKEGIKSLLSFQPVVLPSSKRLIESKPAGAQVFLDGEYLGKTPLTVTAGGGQILYLHMENYQPLFFAMNDKPKLFFTLFTDETDKQKKIDDAQTLFYTSLGMFIVSLAAPIAMFTMQRNLLDKSNILASRGDMAAAQQAKTQAQTYAIAFWSTSGASAGLLGWSIYQLVHYVRTSAQNE